MRDWGEHVLDVADIPPTVNESDSDVSSCESIPEEESVVTVERNP